MLLFVLVFGSIAFSVIVVGVAGYGLSEHRASVYRHNREEALSIAEAGVNYYRWHLAHNRTDYTDGTGHAGPYVHDYTDKDGNMVGHYSLNIIAPTVSSTVITIESTGWLNSQPASKRTLRVKIGFKSLTDYALVSNGQLWISNNAVMHGKLHSNSGIRFDGTTDAEVSSAVATYQCAPIHGSGCTGDTKPGIWGQGGPQSFWKFPVPAQDFTSVGYSLANIKTQAQAGGLYLSASGKQGWLLHFTNDGKVTASKVASTKCYKGQDVPDVTNVDNINNSKWQWFCVDIKNTDAETTYALPANGFLFVDDTVWVDGTLKGRVTVGVTKSALFNGTVQYLAKDGTNVLGLIAGQDVIIPHDSLNTMEINGAMIAQQGAMKRYYYSGDQKLNLTIFGSIITNGTWVWSWVSLGGAVVSGYQHVSTTYDTNLTYNSPLGFPVSVEYNLLSWEEVK